MESSTTDSKISSIAKHIYRTRERMTNCLAPNIYYDIELEILYFHRRMIFCVTMKHNIAIVLLMEME